MNYTGIRRTASCLSILIFLATAFCGGAAAAISCYDCHGSREIPNLRTADFRPVMISTAI